MQFSSVKVFISLAKDDIDRYILLANKNIDWEGQVKFSLKK